MNVLTRGGYALPGTSLDFKTGSWRNLFPLHNHLKAPCHDACPAGEDQQAWLARIQEGRWKEAWESLVMANPMPGVTGRVCPHPCETACNRGDFDEPIAIHNVERFLGDEAVRQGWEYPSFPPNFDGPSVAVVGGGPAGISASYHLLRRGVKVTMFDALPSAGGLLRSAIPMTRLPREVLDAELERILALGIDFRPRQRLGRDMSLGELEVSYDAVFLGIGAQKSREWSVNGEVPADMHDGLHLLKEWVDHGKVHTPKKVAIHGGGNTAVDLARVMKRAGCDEVSVITASGLPGPGVDPGDVLNVVPRELEEALEEGVVFHAFHTIQRLIMRGSRLVGIEVARLKKIPDGKGRSNRVAFEGTERVLNVDMVIPAIGEVVDPEGVEKLIGQASNFRPDHWGGLADNPGVYVGGDARSGAGTVAAAIGDGRRAAEAIRAAVGGDDAPVMDERGVIEANGLNLEYYEAAPRVAAPLLPPEDRTDATEIEGSLSQPEAAAEAARCLSCGNCLACDNCWTLCPDNAVVKTVEMASDGSHYVFDYDFCKGCGLCATECPCGYIEMRVERRLGIGSGYGGEDRRRIASVEEDVGVTEIEEE